MTSVGSDSFSYDDAGRQTNRTIGSVAETLTWTPTGMAGSHAVGSDVTRFVYDADDNRILRIDPDATVTTTIGGMWETDGTTDASYYRFNGGPIGVRSITGSSDELTYIVSDMLGTVSVGYNHTTSGTVTRSWYDPWGVTRAVSGNTPTELSYTGQRQDPTGLMHYQARLYDPAYQTFLTPDTIIPNPTSPQDLNRYAYVRNNPVNNIDPTGHCTNTCLWYDTGAVDLVDEYGSPEAAEDAASQQWLRDMPPPGQLPDGTYWRDHFFPIDWDSPLVFGNGIEYSFVVCGAVCSAWRWNIDGVDFGFGGGFAAGLSLGVGPMNQPGNRELHLAPVPFVPLEAQWIEGPFGFGDPSLNLGGAPKAWAPLIGFYALEWGEN